MQLENQTISKILDVIREEVKKLGNGFHGYSFEICYNPLAMKNLFVRYIKANISNPERVREEFVFVCFDRNGNPLDCKPIFENQEDEAFFLGSMITERKYDRL